MLSYILEYRQIRCTFKNIKYRAFPITFCIIIAELLVANFEV